MKNTIKKQILKDLDNGKNLKDIAFETKTFLLNSPVYLLIDMKDFDEDGFDVLIWNNSAEFEWEHYENLKTLPNCIWELLEDTENFQANVKNYNEHMEIQLNI